MNYKTKYLFENNLVIGVLKHIRENPFIRLIGEKEYILLWIEEGKYFLEHNKKVEQIDKYNYWIFTNET